MKIRVSDPRFNNRKVRRDIIRQIAGFQNLSSNPQFQRDVETARSALRKAFGDTFIYIQRNWDKSFKSKVPKNLEYIFRDLKKAYPNWPSFKIARTLKLNHKSLNRMIRINISRLVEGDIAALVNKWHIRRGDATAMVYGNDYPPYLCEHHDFIRGLGERDNCEGNIKKIRKLRVHPTPKRPWWESRIKNKSLEKSVWGDAMKGKRIVDIYNSLPNADGVSYDTVKKSIHRKRKRAGL